MARSKEIELTSPPKPIFEEKMLFGLLWNRNLRGFWRQELGESFFERLRRLVPYTWMVDPAPLPPHAAIPELNLTDWRQLKDLSQRERELILKVSGFSDKAWGARGVYPGQRPFDRRLVGRGGRCPSVLSAIALCFATLPQTRLGRPSGLISTRANRAPCPAGCVCVPTILSRRGRRGPRQPGRRPGHHLSGR